MSDSEQKIYENKNTPIAVDSKVLRKIKRIQRDPLHQGIISERTTLKPRHFNVQLQRRLGKQHLVGNSTSILKQSGFSCSICDCVLKDSITYLDHINGKWHQRALGISMRVEKVNAAKVWQRL